MARKSRTNLNQSDFLVVRSKQDNSIVKIITPQHFEVGLQDDEFHRVLLVHGSVQSTKGVFSPHISGSLTALLDGTPYLKSGTNIQITTGSDGSVTINSSLSGTPNALSAGDVLSYTGGGSYDTAVAKTLNFDLTGLSTTTATGTDTILVRTGATYKKTTLSSVMSIGAIGIGHPITLGSGIVDTAGAASSWDNTANVTLAVGLAATPALEFDVSTAKLRVKVDGSTISRTASGLSTLKVPNALAETIGISSFSYDGSATSTIGIDTAVVPQLSVNNVWSGKNTFGLSPSAGLTGSLQEVSSGVPYMLAGNNVTITTASSGQITIAAAFSAASALTSGNGITIPGGYDGSTTKSVTAVGDATKGITVASSGIGLDASSLSSSGNRSSYFFLSDGSTAVTKSTVGTIIDEVSRIAIVAEKVNGGIQIDFNGNSNPAQFSIDLDGSTLSVGPGGISVANLPNSLSEAIGIAAFSFDGSSAKTVGIDTTIVPRKNVDNIWSGKNTFGVSTTSGLTGSLQEVSSGVPYLLAGAGALITTGSNGQITISATGAGGTITSVVAGDGLSGGGSSGNVTVNVDLATDPGLKFTSNKLDVKVNSNDTIRKDSSGLAVNKVPNSLGAGTGISSFGFDGSSAGQVVSIDQTQVPLLSNNNTWTGDNIFNAGLSGSLQMLSDGATEYLAAGTGIAITTASNGQVTIAATGGSGISSISQAGGSSYSNITTMIFTGSVVSEPSAGTAQITPVIGAPEDGDYTDGLFTDFSYGTNIGTAVDRFNEVLKGLAPSAAPTLDDIDCNDSGASAKLSFGSSQSISEYANALPSTLTPTNNLSNVDINSAYSSITVSNDIRVACFVHAAGVVIDGTLNADVSADGVNYAADSFGNADQGTLKLFVNNNSTEVHSVDLSSFGSGNSLNGDGSGFNLSAKTAGHFADSTNFETFQHRQGTYLVHSASQREGWNYARVVHTIGVTDITCNYICWVNDGFGSAVAMSSSGAALTGLSMTGTKNLSGVKYNTGGSAQYAITIANAYRNVYSTSQITFGGSNTSVSAENIPSIDYGAGEDETKSIVLSGLTANITGDPILNGSISVNTNVPHPLKSNLSSAGSQSISGILLYNLSNTSTTTSESFKAENYRIKSGSYVAQADIIAGSNTWNSTTSLATVDGMLFYNSRLYSPNQGGVSGDFRNTADGGSITNGPSSNVNYSGISSGLRTFYRYFKNTSGGSKSNWSLTVNGSGTIVSQGTVLSSSRIHILAKLPTTSAAFATGWMDLAVAFATGQVGDAAGCLDGSLDSSLNATNSGTFGTQSAGANEYVVIKIEADASWTGYVSSMSISWS